MKFLKENTLLMVFIFIGVVTFTTLAILSSSVSTELEEIGKDISREKGKQESTLEELSVFQNLEFDYSQALEELTILADVEKKQFAFWKKILNPRENHMMKWVDKTPESVNADITRLFTTLRSRCIASEVELPSESSNSPTIGFGNPNKMPENNYGFGFSAYDGFWPSFSKEEAKSIGVQAKIIKELVEFITQSAGESKGLSIIEILRESAGTVDQSHIEDDQLVVGSETQLLLREKNLFNSLVFKIKLVGQSKHARKFINQLRPPFMLRNFSVKRDLLEIQTERTQQDFIPNPFAGEPDQPAQTKKETLPIVKDVNSEFSFLIEYITDINNGIEEIFSDELLRSKPNPDTIAQFLTDSGNADKLEAIKSLITSGE